MSTRRLGVAVAVLGGFLYAVGGSDGTSPLNTGTFLYKAQIIVLACNNIRLSFHHQFMQFLISCTCTCTGLVNVETGIT